MKVSEAMTPSVVTVSRDTPLADAARLMRDSDVGPLPVADGGRLVGVLTDRDITIRAVAEGKDPFSTRVDEVMTPKVVCCLDTDDVEPTAHALPVHNVFRDDIPAEPLLPDQALANAPHRDGHFFGVPKVLDQDGGA